MKNKLPLLAKDKTLIEHHTKVSFKHVYVVFGVEFECDMGENYTLIMFNNCQTDYHGVFQKEKYGYILKHQGLVIFHGYDLGLPYMVSEAIHIMEAIETILSFLSVNEYDTDGEYFANYTPRQINWRDSHAESLSGFNYSLQSYITDDDDNDGDYFPTFDSLFYMEQGYVVGEVLSGLELPELIIQLDLTLNG